MAKKDIREIGAVKFDLEKSSKREIVRRADEMIQRYSRQVNNQADSITRLLADPDGIREIMRLQELLAEAERQRDVLLNMRYRVVRSCQDRLDEMDRSGVEKGYAPMLRDFLNVLTRPTSEKEAA